MQDSVSASDHQGIERQSEVLDVRPRPAGRCLEKFSPEIDPHVRTGQNACDDPTKDPIKLLKDLQQEPWRA